MKKFYSITKGFTIAEILITIGVIGLVASLTFPNLIKIYDKQVTISKIKENYNIINQTLVRAASEHYINIKDLFDITAPMTQSAETITTNFVQSNILPYIYLAKNCGWSTASACGMEKQYYLNKNLDGNYASSWYRLFLRNGASMFFAPNNDGINWMGMIIVIDINGNNKPNTYGKDVFEFVFSSASKKVDFYGINNLRNSLKTNSNDGCNSDAKGVYCGALIEKDGWQITDDYPWEP